MMSNAVQLLIEQTHTLQLDQLTLAQQADCREDGLLERALSTEDGRRALRLSEGVPELEDITLSLFGSDL